MSKKFKFASAAAGAAVLIATGFTGGAASAADTEQASQDCKPAHLCLWEHTGYSGWKIVEWAPLHSEDTYELADTALHRASSVQNNSHLPVLLYSGRAGNGMFLCVTAGGASADLAELGFADKATSMKAYDPGYC
ncbi:peptidase inhibitor family I36 protein [Glycomyces rhizosphaerae]|uniref:Peptidase inhibitor family I36 protein n=1 Tax=Glycomyces rhizosphaerae TaxID=2054422 RepID=A0ABV7PR06_9ACTN